MELAELELLLPMEAEEADRLFEQFRLDQGSDDLDRFLAWLYQNGHVGSEAFRALHAVGDLALASMDELAAADPEGQLDGIDARFDFLGVLGRGAMGEIHVARERDLRRKVALKFLLPDRTAQPAVARRFFREIQITAQLEHPNIVPVYALETDDDGAPACAMKLIQGNTLRTYIKDVRTLTERGSVDDDHSLNTRLEHFLKVCDAIAYAHSRGIIHRDLKPSNIMIGPYNEVYVMDWGIARPISYDGPEDALDAEAVGSWGNESDSRDEAGLFETHAGTVVGTPHYMAPEQAEGRTDLDARADLYALGLILHELVGLEPANPGESPTEALEEAMMGSVLPLRRSSQGAAIPPELIAIVDKTTAWKRDDRYPTVEALTDDLRRYLRGEAVRARPDTPLQSMLRWISRNREKTAALLALGVFLVLLSLVGGLVRERSMLAEARAREEALGAALTTVSGRAARIDRELLRVQALLEGLGAAASQALAIKEVADWPYLLDDDFEDPARAPADLAFSARYNKPVSVDWPVQVLAPGVQREDVEPLLRRLATLKERYPQLMVRSRPDVTSIPNHDQLRSLVADEGVPVVWAYVALAEGVHSAYPGKAGYPVDYDPRERPWYQLSAFQYGPRWGNAYLDSQGQGLLLPCTMALYDGDGKFRGVAGLELTFAWIVDNLLELPELSGVQESFLLTEGGRVVVSTRFEDAGAPPTRANDDTLDLPLFDELDVVTAMLDGRSGYREIANPDGTSRIVAWYRMNALGWYYAVTADAGAMLADTSYR